MILHGPKIIRELFQFLTSLPLFYPDYLMTIFRCPELEIVFCYAFLVFGYFSALFLLWFRLSRFLSRNVFWCFLCSFRNSMSIFGSGPKTNKQDNWVVPTSSSRGGMPVPKSLSLFLASSYATRKCQFICYVLNLFIA